MAEALHAGGRSLIFEWSRVSILTRRHLFLEIVHSAANIALLKTFNGERYAIAEHCAGQTNESICPGRTAGEERALVLSRRTACSAMTLMGHRRRAGPCELSS